MRKLGAGSRVTILGHAVAREHALDPEPRPEDQRENDEYNDQQVHTGIVMASAAVCTSRQGRLSHNSGEIAYRFGH